VDGIPPEFADPVERRTVSSVRRSGRL